MYPSRCGNDDCGEVSRTVNVRSSTTVSPDIASAVIGVPSWNVQPSSSVIVQVWLSSDSMDAAISFSGAAVSASYRTSLENTASSGSPPQTSWVRAGTSGFWGLQPRIETAPPELAEPPPSLSPSSPPHALTTRARPTAATMPPLRAGTRMDSPPKICDLRAPCTRDAGRRRVEATRDTGLAAGGPQ